MILLQRWQKAVHCIEIFEGDNAWDSPTLDLLNYVCICTFFWNCDNYQNKIEDEWEQHPWVPQSRSCQLFGFCISICDSICNCIYDIYWNIRRISGNNTLDPPTFDLVLGHERKEVEAETRTITPSSHLQQSRLRFSQMNNISIACELYMN